MDDRIDLLSVEYSRDLLMYFLSDITAVLEFVHNPRTFAWHPQLLRLIIATGGIILATFTLISQNLHLFNHYEVYNVVLIKEIELCIGLLNNKAEIVKIKSEVP